MAAQWRCSLRAVSDPGYDLPNRFLDCMADAHIAFSLAQASCTGLRVLDFACEAGFEQQGILLFQVRSKVTRLRGIPCGFGPPVPR